MDTKKWFVVFSAGLILAGCGDWRQNPLDRKKGDFGAGKPVPTPIDKAKALPSEAVQIYIPDFQSFEEGVKTEFPITARVFLDDYRAEIVVENLADFPGATFDQNTGVFQWTPPAGFVESEGGEGFIV